MKNMKNEKKNEKYFNEKMKKGHMKNSYALPIQNSVKRIKPKLIVMITTPRIITIAVAEEDITHNSHLQLH